MLTYWLPKRWAAVATCLGIGSLVLTAAAVPKGVRSPGSGTERVGYAPQVFAITLDGDATRLTHGQAGHYAPTWAPHGRRLASGTAGDVEVITRRDGRVLRRFEGGPDGASTAAWSPDGERVAFVAYHGHNGWLVVASLRTGGQRTVADHAAGLVDWSRDGRHLFYLGAKSRISTVPRGGGSVRKLVSGVHAFGGLSPNGHWLLFTRRPGGNAAQELWIARVDGSDERRLLDQRFFPFNYGWAPGDRGVWAYLAGSDDPQRPAVISRSGKRHHLSVKVTGNVFAWSPDARRVAWSYEPHQGAIDVLTARPDGSHERTLARFASKGFPEVHALAWSPDSRYLAVEASRHEGD